MTLTDTHAHFYPGADHCQTIDAAIAAGVTRIIAVGGNPELNTGALQALAAAPGTLRATLGLDRDQAADLTDAGLGAFEKLLAQHSFCGIGETGLDYHHHPETRARQCRLFAAMYEAARRHHVPVVIHTREADGDTLAVLDEGRAGAPVHGVVHCFTGSRAFARELLDRGLYISFSGIVTFRNAGDLRDTAAYVPADRLLIETDSPYLAPVPLRGKTNQPAFLVHVAGCVAQCRGLPPDELAALTTANAQACFGCGGDARAGGPV